MATYIPFWEILARILVAFAASFIFGLDRQFKKKPVSFGVFAFVTTGATVLTVGAEMLAENPFVLLGSIVTGIGFLGAGAILKSGDKRVSGMTTAASLWAFAALGITIGLGLYIEALIFYALIALVITIDHYFEKHGFGSHSKTVTITLNDQAKVKDVEKMLPLNHKIFFYDFSDAKKEYIISFFMSGEKQEINMTLNQLIKHPAVSSVRVES